MTSEAGVTGFGPPPPAQDDLWNPHLSYICSDPFLKLSPFLRFQMDMNLGDSMPTQCGGTLCRAWQAPPHPQGIRKCVPLLLHQAVGPRPPPAPAPPQSGRPPAFPGCMAMPARRPGSCPGGSLPRPIPSFSLATWPIGGGFHMRGVGGFPLCLISASQPCLHQLPGRVSDSAHAP